MLSPTNKDRVCCDDCCLRLNPKKQEDVITYQDSQVLVTIMYGSIAELQHQNCDRADSKVTLCALWGRSGMCFPMPF